MPNRNIEMKVLPLDFLHILLQWFNEWSESIKQAGANFTSCKLLKLADHTTYIDSNISSTESDFSICIKKCGMLLTCYW